MPTTQAACSISSTPPANNIMTSTRQRGLSSHVTLLAASPTRHQAVQKQPPCVQLLRYHRCSSSSVRADSCCLHCFTAHLELGSRALSQCAALPCCVCAGAAVDTEGVAILVHMGQSLQGCSSEHYSTRSDRHSSRAGRWRQASLAQDSNSDADSLCPLQRGDCAQVGCCRTGTVPCG
jgi:hypothetical protein